jgi:hypothetical protein
MTAETDVAGKMAAHRLDGGLQPLLVSRRASAGRWALRARLAKGKIAAEDGEAGGGEGFGESDEERSIAVGSSAVGEDEAIAGGLNEAVAVAVRGLVEESANRKCAGCVRELLRAIPHQNVILRALLVLTVAEAGRAA